MAFLTVTNVTVDRIFYDGRGVALTESYQSRGEQRKAYYTAWFDTAPNLNLGDVIPEVSGVFSVKEEEFDGKDGEKKRAIKTSINSARIGSGNRAAQSAPEQANTDVPF